MSKVREWGISVIRTAVVPPLAGFIITWLINHGITQIQSTWVYTVVAFLCSGAYYMLLRLVEIIAVVPWVKRLVGLFLGHPSSPTYKKP